MDTKLRVITDIAPTSGSVRMPGMGGTDTTALSMIDVWNQPEELTQKMMQEISLLKEEATRQEVSFEELTQTMKDRKSTWAATPSIWPVRGWVTSGFGSRISPFTGRVAMHNGIDIATRRDTPIVAPASGLVSYVGYDSGLGRMIRINHRQGVQTVYGHLAKADVEIGQRIKRGDVIGAVGSTGMSTGPHLHYEVFINGLPVDPSHYIIE
jgi:murein DD-endopeptidase MepM/ murein hydrolase activator NlpD